MKKTIFIVLCLLLSLSLFAQNKSFLSGNVKPVVMPSARASGFGGVHVAQGDDFASIFSNPATFAGQDGSFNAAEISFSVYGPSIELAKLAINGGELGSLVGNSGLAVGMDLGGPIAIGWVGNGLGFGLFNRTVVDATVSSSLKIRPQVSEEVALVGGYSFRVLDRGIHKLDVGFLAKGFVRAVVGTGLVLTVSDLTDDPVQKLLDSNIETQLGFGVDLGVRYTLFDWITVAATAYDVFSPVYSNRYTTGTIGDFKLGDLKNEDKIAPRLAMGAMVNVPVGPLDKIITNAIVMVDYRDVLDPLNSSVLIHRNPLLNFSLGTEVTFFKMISLRAGIADTLASVGVGFDLKVLKLDLAMRGKELGYDPGSNSVYAIDFGLLFRY